jgi:hypothetical protein
MRKVDMIEEQVDSINGDLNLRTQQQIMNATEMARNLSKPGRGSPEKTGPVANLQRGLGRGRGGNR